MKSKKRCFLCRIVLPLCFLILLFLIPCETEAEKSYSIPGDNYVLPDNSDYELSAGTAVNSFFYEAKSLGSLNVQGAVDTETTYNGIKAYGVSDAASIHYAYNGRNQYDNVDQWYIDNDGTGKVNSYGLGFLQGVGHGCIIIEKSLDGKHWSIIQDPIKNYFTGKKTDKESLIYNIPEAEIKNGCYYRVLVAYRFSRRIGDGFWFVGDRHEYKKCIELYTFYVCSEKNYVTFPDLRNKLTLKDQGISEAGFMIRKNGSRAVVTVQGEENECPDYDLFVEPGEYNINIKTQLGKEYNYKITVSKGLDFTPLQPQIYRSEKDKGFPLSTVVSSTAFGSNLTSLSLVIPKGFEIKQNDSKYGITGDSVSLYLKLNKGVGGLGNGWMLSADNWGNRKQKTCGVETGEVGHGALIIQTSVDGQNWNTIDKGRYNQGLYTTDYAYHYGTAENVPIYTPSGYEVIRGVYIRVLFAYQVNNVSTNQYQDYVEKYQFYLCSNELGAVTFHNLSVANDLEKTFADQDQDTIEVYKQAESLEDGAYTATGFEIDKRLNSTVKHTILRNGKNVDNAQSPFEETGKYEITLTSAVGDTKDLTIYVDRMTPEEAMKQYFGEGFIAGKRIFSERDYPVYEGGETSYYLAGVDNNTLPLYGRITNLSTGSVMTIEQNHDEKTGIISEPGEYQAIFATSEKVFTEELTGDARVFTFRFQVIPQGTAPGPVVNQKLLEEYSHSTVTDCNPVYYGLTFSSAGKGNITRAFASKKAAIEYAYNYEKGTVEKQDNGEYRYTGSFLVDQKTKFNSAWNLTDAVNYFAEVAVHKHYFDMSDEFTYLSLTDEVLKANENLRQLELPKSVTIFAELQKEQLTNTNALPFLNDKPYAYLNLETGKEDRGVFSFEFITDQYGGIDSKNVTITDGNGKQHAIRYSESVGQQLLADNCPSGIVTVREETMYGDAVEYQAVYIAPGENQTELTIQYSSGNENHTVIYKGSADEQKINADSFTITKLYDPLDAYAFVVVNHNQYEEVYTAKDQIDTVWAGPGTYNITCLNRMGYGYTVSVTIMGEEGMPRVEQTIQENMVNKEETTEAKPANVQIETKSDTANANTVQPQTTTAKDENEREVTIEDKNKGNDNATIIIVGISLILLIALIVLAYRRIRLFSRVVKNQKSGEEEKHV